jgi:hypothetical protein
MLYKTEFHLQFTCKYASKLHDACSFPANIPQNCTLFAGFQQVYCKNTYHLQGFCKYVTKMHFACRTSCKRCTKRKDVGRD